MSIMLQTWQLARLAPDPAKIPAAAVRLARLAGARVFALKVTDGTGLFGEFAERQVLYQRTASALREVGVEVAAWGFHYGRAYGAYVRAEAAAVLRARDRLGFTTYFVDAESAWEQSAREGDAAALVEPLKRKGLTVWLEAWKYPSYHPAMRWDEWAEVLNGGWAPQVYWEQATNAAAQVERSHREHIAIADLPFWPVLPAFCERDWCPTADEFRAAVAKAHELGAAGVGAWKAEWLTEHWPARKPFVDALAGWPDDDTPPEPPEPPEPEPCDVTKILARARDLSRDAEALLRAAQALERDIEAMEHDRGH